MNLPEAEQSQPITVWAEAANHWQQGAYEVWVLRGRCRIIQGASVSQCGEAVLWIDRAGAGEAYARQLAGAAAGSPPQAAPWMPGQPGPSDAPVSRQSKVIAYLEGDVVIDRRGPNGPVKIQDQNWFGRFYTTRGVQVQAALVAGCPDVLPGIFQRGMERRSPAWADVVRRTNVQPAQFTAPRPEPAVGSPLPPNTRRVRAFPRGDIPVQVQWFPDPASNLWIAAIDSGVNLIVEGLQDFGSIDVSADRLVVWTAGTRELDLTGQTPQDERAPLEIYMEGNIVFRQGERVIHAQRMYYDVRNQVGTVLDAEVLTPVRKYEGLLRLRAEVLQQVGRDRFVAQHAYLTSSRLGVPRYRLQASEINYEDIQHPVINPYTGLPDVDPATGQPSVEHEKLASARNNLLFLDELPVFYWPVIAADLEDPTFFIRRVRFRQDNVFGTQILTDWSVYQLLGIRHRPEGTDWELSLDYMSKRGFGHGMTYLYRRDQLFDIPGPIGGLADYWGIYDNGFDNLGIDRPHLKPEENYRYRFLWQHRHQLPEGFLLTAEVGKQSDRTFLQEYFKREWDELKDQTTDIELKRLQGNTSWDIFAQARLDEFYTQTEWLPRFDHFWLGQELLNDSLTWYEHSSLGYARFQRLNPPERPQNQPFSYLEWEQSDRQGERLITRHEFDWPFQLGPLKMVPYVLGEAGRWGQDIHGDDLNRFYYQAGIRANLPMWSVDPTVESAFWNVHGLAHKVEFELGFSYSQSNRSINDLPLYDPLDDANVEDWRRRFATYTFNNPSTIPPKIAQIPARFDERSYALRTGMADWVTAPGMEIADDLLAVRAGVHQRWQTKRGMPENRHIIDWIVLDTNATFFPDPDRDNFGEVLGLLDYNFTWHVGDRLTLVSEGMFDMFADGQKIVSVGAFLTRPPRGALYAGVHILEGPIHSDVLAFSYSYFMSPKWVSSYGITFDVASPKNIGQTLRITRVGESLLVSAGFSYDPARDTFGFNFMAEPRFLPRTQLGQVGGAHIPPAGAFGLE